MKCRHCPLRDAAAECPAITLPHPPYCRRVDPDDPEHNPAFIAIIAAKAGAPIPPAPSPIAGAVEQCGGCGQTSEPSLARKAVTFAGAVVRHVAAGLPTVDAATYEARLAVCSDCPELRYGWRCAKCGCPLLKKARWQQERCPLSKWPGERIEASRNPEMDWARGGSI